MIWTAVLLGGWQVWKTAGLIRGPCRTGIYLFAFISDKFISAQLLISIVTEVIGT